MSLDIRRVRGTPFKKLEKPRHGERFTLAKKVFAELANRTARFLLLAAAFLLPAWVWDFGVGAGLGRIFALTVILGLMLLLMLLPALWLGSPLTLRWPLLTKIGLTLAMAALLSSVFSLDPKVSFGLTSLSSAPLGVVLMFAFLFFSFVINRPFTPAYLKKLLGSYLLGSTVLTIYIAVRFFFSGYEPLAWVARDGWLSIFNVTIFLLASLAISTRGAAKALWSAALLPHFLVLFLWDQTIPWIIILIGASIWLVMLVRRRSNLIYPAQILAVAALLLFLPIKVFTGNNAPLVSSYSYQEIGQAIVSERLQNLVFGVGPGSGAALLGQARVSFFDPDPEAGAALFASETSFDANDTVSEFPAEAVINNGYAFILIEHGIISAFLWLVLIIVFLVYALGFLKQSPGEEANLGAGLALASILLVFGLAAAPWSFATAMILIFLLGLTVMFHETAPPAVHSLGEGRRRQHHLPLVIRVWSFRLGGGLAIIFYLAVVVMSSRVVLAARQANAALSTDAPGVAENHWLSAGRLNPWNDLYQVKRAESRLLALSESTALPEQKDIIESANLVFSKINRYSSNVVARWLVSRLYIVMAPFVEGSLPLARGSYLKALELWPTNVALATELARLYRFRLDALVSADRSAQALNEEAKDALKHALKLSPSYLPARLELAFLMEKLSGIPAAVAELESWEDASPEIRYHLGRLYFNDNKLDIAEEKFLQVIKDEPNHSNAHYSLGVVYFRQGEYTKSLKEFEKVLEMNPGNEDVKVKIEEVKKKVK